jgi:hypothetical protein
LKKRLKNQRLQEKENKKIIVVQATSFFKKGDYNNMNEITKVSDITAQDLADYIRLIDYTEDDLQTLNNLLNVAITFISNYTGREQTELDNYQDFVIVALILVQDMWDNRTLYVDKNNLNKVVETILGMHSVNLL